MKNFITNPNVFNFLSRSQVNEALGEPIKSAPANPKDKLRQHLFGNPARTEDSLLTGLILGDFLYDYIRIDPLVVEGVDFSRKEDLDNIFSFAGFADKIQYSHQGNFSQMQGYVAERVAAWQLQSQGYEVSFPETPNQPGYDLLVDGKEFQVKCVETPQAVLEHIRRYPDIPVIANIELADQLKGHNNVFFMPEISHDVIAKQTADSIHHAADLQDLEIPWITAMVSTGINLRRLCQQNTTWTEAFTDVGTNIAGRTVGGWVGQHGISVIGGIFLGPAGAVVGGLTGGIIGSRYGRTISNTAKGTFNHTQRQRAQERCVQLLDRGAGLIDKKLAAKESKKQATLDIISDRSSSANSKIRQWMMNRFGEDSRYYSQQQTQMRNCARDFSKVPGSDFFAKVLNTLQMTTRASIHPAELQDRLEPVYDCLEGLHKPSRSK